MSPIIIERSDFLKLGALAMVLGSGVFLSGVLYGYSKAEIHRNSLLDSHELALPDVDVMVVAERSARVPDTAAPGYDRDVDRAEDSDDPGAHQHAGIEPESQPPAVKTVEPGQVDAPLGAAGDTAEDVPAAVGGPLEPAVEDPLVQLKDTADEISARYTVQIGLFADEDNAERRVESLLAKRINAYATSYTGTDKRRLFNVRFGYFDNVHNARAALDAFKTLFATDAYLVPMNR